ncbi:sugar kinase [Pseudarthrobacter sp. NPDC092419]|uniref:sugar kinase n=1 Tax=Pseudarthrobacter sp. NPDC092419 TaxID=3364414 RepID=UPI003806A713
MVSLRSAGPLASGGNLVMHVAGAESNVAAGVARLGHSVAWAGVLGDDPHGEFIRRQLRSEGIDVQCRIDPERSTGVMFLEQRTADISRAFYYRAHSAGSQLSREDVQRGLERGPAVLHLTGITPALGPLARDTVEHAARSAADAGAVVSLDVNFRSKLWSRGEAREVLTNLVQYATIVIASDDELALVSPAWPGRGDSVDAEAAMAAELLAGGVREVVVKRGAAGAGVYTSGGRREAPAVPVTSVDTVGAGDAFTAGYLSALLDGEDAAGRLQRGVLTGAFAVSTGGDWEGLPRRAELALLTELARGTTQR